jgi:hypothetical protein
VLDAVGYPRSRPSHRIQAAIPEALDRFRPHGQAVTQYTKPLEAAVEAHVGDRILVRATHQGEVDRAGEVLECHEPGGGPPYLVRWDGDGHTGLFFPAGSAVVVHVDAAHG